MERTLLKYFTRMCDRCTPFGLFAGVSVGTVAAEARLRLTGRPRYRRRSVLDFAQVPELVAALLRTDENRQSVRYRPNDTLAHVQGGWQYVETIYGDREIRYEVASLEQDESLFVVLERAANGATLADLRATLAAGVRDVTESEIADYVEDLVAAQVLQPELTPAVVGDDSLDQVINLLRSDATLAAAEGPVRGLREAMNRLDSHGVGAPSEAYAAVNAVWTDDLKQKKTDRLLQVDLFKEGDDLQLAANVVEQVLCGAEPLWRIAGPVPDEMHAIKRRFRERYESREVPLAEAFDPERGIGMPGPDFEPRIALPPLLNGLELRASGRVDDVRDPESSYVLVDRVMGSCGSPPRTLELDDELLESLSSPECGVLPDALAVHFELLASSDKAICQGDYRIFYHGISGPSGARLLGRFCHLDPDLLKAVRGHLRDEEALEPDALYAEIVHSPEGRLGNVVRRPHLRAVELTCAGHSRRTGLHRLTVDDLLLRLDGGQFHLRSKRDGRTVRPRLTSAHNYRLSSGIYRFLCALQGDGIMEGITWNWGSLNRLRFLPRVIRGRAVYALARWRVGRDRPAYKAIGIARNRSAGAVAARRLVDELPLPRWVRLVDGDSRLLLDLKNELCLAVLAEHAAKRPAVTLEEVLAEDLEGCVEGPEGKYRNEIVLPIVRSEPHSIAESDSAEPPKRIDTAPSSRPIQRVFAPGDEWLYFKIYCAPPTADLVLREVVAPLAELHRREEPEQPWFFVRYADPESHLRVRFRGTAQTQRAIQERATAMLRPFVVRSSVQSVAIDTYVRETERYGGTLGIQLAESLFHADSVSILRIIEQADADADDALVWQHVALGFDRLLVDFELDFTGRERVVSKAREGFAGEFDIDAAIRRQLSRSFRAERAALANIVTGRTDSALASADQVFGERSTMTVDIVSKLRHFAEIGELECAMDDLLINLLHMHANRVLIASARAQEFVIHELLSRTYRSLAARGQSAEAVGRSPD